MFYRDSANTCQTIFFFFNFRTTVAAYKKIVDIFIVLNMNTLLTKILNLLHLLHNSSLTNSYNLYCNSSYIMGCD